MQFISPETIKILEYAQQREIETRDFYRECLQKATIGGTKKLLQTLVDDEERHYTIVTNLLEEARMSQPPQVPGVESPPSAKSTLTDIFSHHMVDDSDFEAESATVGQMLKKALENEKESYDNYAEAEKEAEEPEIKSLYAYLAGEENKHYILVSNLIDYLADPGNWLYEEENLVFRRG